VPNRRLGAGLEQTVDLSKMFVTVGVFHIQKEHLAALKRLERRVKPGVAPEPEPDEQARSEDSDWDSYRKTVL
jgi:hypothetical protein